MTYPEIVTAPANTAEEKLFMEKRLGEHTLFFTDATRRRDGSCRAAFVIQRMAIKEICPLGKIEPTEEGELTVYTTSIRRQSGWSKASPKGRNNQ
jgi:hypothetical protein